VAQGAHPCGRPKGRAGAGGGGDEARDAQQVGIAAQVDQGLDIAGAAA